jgi:hypothetical protein
MTSSGTYNFSLSNGELVLDAYERCGIFAPQLEQKHFFTARRQLNLMLLSEISNRGVNLWKVELISQLLTQATATYTLPGRVIMMLDAYRSTNQGQATQLDIYITPISRDDYAAYPMKQTQGQPNQYWFDRLITPTVTLYPVPDGNGPYYLNYYACVQVQDSNIPSGSTPDVPVRWYDALCAGLAWRVSRTFAPAKTQQLKSDYDEAWKFAATEDVENVPVRISPGIGRYYR